MKIDYELALIELTAEESEIFRNDPTYRQRIKIKAGDLSDKTKRTVEIYDHEGSILDIVSNY